MFNLIKVPGRHPFISKFPQNVLFVVRQFQTSTFEMQIALTAGLLYLSLAKERNGTLSGWLRENRWALPLTVGVLFTPLSLLGRLKIGGADNAYIYSIYFLVIACCSLAEKLLAERREGVSGSLRKAFVAAILISVILIGVPLNLHAVRKDKSTLSDVMVAYNYLRKHPGEVYFPMQPLAHLEAEGKSYHYVYGVYDRWLAGFPVSQSHFESHMPPHCKLICLPATDPEPLDSTELVIDRNMTDYEQSEPLPELPQFQCYRKRK